MAVIGIDLGTTNSLAAIWKNGEAVIIPNSNGSSLTPSVVSVLDDSTVLVGQSAKERLITHPKETASCFKRTMGQKYFYDLGDKVFSSVELSALVLKNLKQDAEKFLGEEVEEAVISVPAYFNQHQRKATVNAAKYAGLKVERLVSEPTAAALCHGIQNAEGMSTALVLDLGGGTFDVSLLELFDGVIDVKAVSGDNQLGGEDYTRAIAAWFLSVNDLVDKLSPEDMSKVMKLSEIAKRNVSADENASTVISTTLLGKEINSTLTYKTFQTITADLQNRVLKPIKKVLKDAEITREDVDAVILMGGATRMVNFFDYAVEIFGNKIISGYNPDETVARGAAVLAAMKQHDAAFKETVLTDVCPFSLGVEAYDESADIFSDTTKRSTAFSPIIERNTPVPVSIKKMYSSMFPGQKSVEINVYQGESLTLSEDLFLGKLKVPLSKSKEIEEISIRFTYDINGLLEVEATTLSDNKTSKLFLNNQNVDMTEEEIENVFSNLESIKIAPWKKQENLAIIERAKRLFEETVGEKRELVDEALSKFNKALSTQNPATIKNVAEEVTKFFDSIESEW